MSVRFRLLGVSFTAMCVLLLVPAKAGMAVGDIGTNPPPPSKCPVVSSGQAQTNGAVAEITQQDDISCGRPGNGSPYGTGRASVTSDSVPDGSPCTLIYNAPVTFQDFPSYMLATWSVPDRGASQTRVNPDSNGLLVSTSGIKAGTYDVFAVYTRNGSYQNNTCQSTAAWQSWCREGAPGGEPCTTAVPHLISQLTSPPPSIGPYVNEVIARLRAQAGIIDSLPRPRGLVNLPTCFWIEGMTVPNAQNYRVVLPGPPDPSNRRIYYTFLIRLFFSGIEWNFDDPNGNAQVQPNPACGQHEQLTAHSYQMISERRNSDGFYHVSAAEKYDVTVDMYWIDSYGTHHQSIDPGFGLPITISPPGPYNQYVGQVEGIPVV